MATTDKKILPVVIAGVFHNEKLLLINRKKAPYNAKWGLIGGKIEFAETIQEAIIREIKEEAGISVKWQGIKAVFNERLKDNKGNIINQFLIFLCETKTDTFGGEEQEEGKIKWFCKEELLEIKADIIPSDWYMIENFFIKKEAIISVFEVIMRENNQRLQLELIQPYS